MYADDTSLLFISSDTVIAAKDINADLCNLQQWANLWHITLILTRLYSCKFQIIKLLRVLFF